MTWVEDWGIGIGAEPSGIIMLVWVVLTKESSGVTRVYNWDGV
jgi:hypothetical protein